jgi:hypothetical protein
MFGSIGRFLGGAAKVAGKGLHSATHTVSSATGAVTKLAGKVPFVGPGLHGVLDIGLSGPLRFADNIAGGARVDKAVVSHLKSQVANVKAVAPYAQTVIVLVPAVGPGISGVIGASAALASGQSLSDSLVAGIKGAVPGGALGEAAFKVGQGVMRGDRIETIGLRMLPISAEAKKAVILGLEVAKDLASGKRVDATLVDRAYSQLPSEARKAINVARGKGGNLAQLVADASLKLVPVAQRKALIVGLAVGHAKVLQQTTKKAAASLQTHGALAKMGELVAKTNPVITASAQIVPTGKNGFAVGIGALAHKNVSPRFLMALRKNVHGDDRKAFDIAVATHVGMTTSKAPPNLKTAQQRAGYYTTRGMMGAAPGQKVAMMKEVVKMPGGKQGATVAIIQIADARSSIWHKVKVFLGIEPGIPKRVVVAQAQQKSIK